MPAPFDPKPAAALLQDVWRSGGLLKELPSDCRPATIDQGYDIQDQLIAGLGDTVVGWKLGVGSPRGKAMAGTTRSIAGRILKSRLFKNGETIPMPNQAPVTVEFEIAFVLGHDVAPTDKFARPLDAVGATHVAFEFVLARYVDRRTVGWPSFAADDAGFNALVLGAPVDTSAIGPIRNSIIVSANGTDQGLPATGEDAIDPVAALAEMFDHARDRKLTLPKGTIVSTGTQSLPFNTSGAAARIEARFTGGTLTAILKPPA